MTTPEQLVEPQKVTWCTGCGNFGILAALKKAVVDLDFPVHNLVISSGIGCSGKIPHYIGGLNSIHAIHGRPIPVATGIHMANKDLKVVVHAGDGDTLGEGLGHFVHAARRNVNLAVFIHNNGVMGLTKGQFSPAAPRGYVSNTSPPPPGSPMEPANPVAQAIEGGATFVARGFSGDQKALVKLMVQAVKHRGFAVVDILQPCQTWNRQLTWKFYNENTYSLQDNGHDVSDRMAALEKALMIKDKIPIGVFYQIESTDLAAGIALPEDVPLKDHTTNLKDIQKIIDDLLI
ncbi:MAG: thiamine pyrophosphate-dependent enzyme [Candidatus Thorarchaeota archaeon]